jgi:hypothetical protein
MKHSRTLSRKIPLDLAKDKTKPSGGKMVGRKAKKMRGGRWPEIGWITGDGGARV